MLKVIQVVTALVPLGTLIAYILHQTSAKQSKERERKSQLCKPLFRILQDWHEFALRLGTDARPRMPRSLDEERVPIAALMDDYALNMKLHDLAMYTENLRLSLKHMSDSEILEHKSRVVDLVWQVREQLRISLRR